MIQTHLKLVHKILTQNHKTRKSFKASLLQCYCHGWKSPASWQLVGWLGFFPWYCLFLAHKMWCKNKFLQHILWCKSAGDKIGKVDSSEDRWVFNRKLATKSKRPNLPICTCVPHTYLGCVIVPGPKLVSGWLYLYGPSWGKCPALIMRVNFYLFLFF